MNQNKIHRSKFSNPESKALFHERWPNERKTQKLSYEGFQCLFCFFYAQLNEDWGICCHSKSRHFKETVFEHFTCPWHVRDDALNVTAHVGHQVSAAKEPHGSFATELNENIIAENTFSNPDSEILYRYKWPNERKSRQLHDDGLQCGGCSFFSPLNDNWGICCQLKSRHFLETVFTQFTCPWHVRED